MGSVYYHRRGCKKRRIYEVRLKFIRDQRTNQLEYKGRKEDIIQTAKATIKAGVGTETVCQATGFKFRRSHLNKPFPTDIQQTLAYSFDFFSVHSFLNHRCQCWILFKNLDKRSNAANCHRMQFMFHVTGILCCNISGNSCHH